MVLFIGISTSSVLPCLKNSHHHTTIKVPSCNGIFFPLTPAVFSCLQNQIWFLSVDADLPKVLVSPFQGPAIYPNVPLTLISRVFSMQEGRREGSVGCWLVQSWNMYKAVLCVSSGRATLFTPLGSCPHPPHPSSLSFTCRRLPSSPHLPDIF